MMGRIYVPGVKMRYLEEKIDYTRKIPGLFNVLEREKEETKSQPGTSSKRGASDWQHEPPLSTIN